MTPDDRKVLEQLHDQIQWLYEPDYGDFKRKVGLYLEKLENQYPHMKRGPLLHELKMLVIYNPSGDIEGTRRAAMTAIREAVSAH